MTFQISDKISSLFRFRFRFMIELRIGAESDCKLVRLDDAPAAEAVRRGENVLVVDYAPSAKLTDTTISAKQKIRKRTLFLTRGCEKF